MHKVPASLAIVLLLATVTTTGVAAAEPPTPDGADQVLVRYRADTTRAERGRVAGDHGLTAVRTSPDGRNQVVVAQGRSRATARRELKADPRVLVVANNYRRELTDEITDEPGFARLWGLHNTGQEIDGDELQTGNADVDIDGLEALRIERGDASVVVAVIDDGVDFTHPDLVDRAWTNPGEAGANATNGIDDDGNGYVDDVHGWDFCNNDNTVSDPGEDFHGTHVAGTIAASLNGIGIVGVAPGIKIMALKFIDDTDECGADDMTVDAIDYAASFGAPIVNASWGQSSFSGVIEAAIAESGALFVAAAGNGNRLTGIGFDLDAGGFYPADSTLPNVLTVAAVDQLGDLAPFSNYGNSSVDIAAPGTNTLSSIPDIPASGGDAECNPCWGWLAGTSMAAPHVSGVAALALSVMGGTPSATALRARVLGTGQPLPSTAGLTATGRMVNAWRAVDVTGPVVSPINSHKIDVGSVVGTTVSTTMTWPPATDDLSGVRTYTVRRSLNGAAFTTLTTTSARSHKRTMAFGTPTRFELSARDGAGNTGVAAVGSSIRALLIQDGTSAARYAGAWSTVSQSGASGGRLHRATRAGAKVDFTTTARAIAIVARRGPLNGKARIIVDGVDRGIINLNRSRAQSRVVVFSASWATAGSHRVRVVVLGTAGHPRVEIDAFAILR
jgi:subtilisin family serine protease